MARTCRKRSARGGKAARWRRSSVGKTETTRNDKTFSVTFVIGPQDLTARHYVTPDRSRAFRVAREKVQDGAPIVLVKKGRFQNEKLIADLSTVGGAR